MTISQEIIVEHLPAALPNEDIGARLGYANWQHFGPVQGTAGIGLGFCSCNATVAIKLHDDYEREHYGVFSVVHGNSQIFRGLDPDNPGPDMPRQMFANSGLAQHAEQIAVQVVASRPGIAPWLNNGHIHLYIDLGPCPKCRAWLDARQGEYFVLYYTVRYEDADKGYLGRMHRANRRQFV